MRFLDRLSSLFQSRSTLPAAGHLAQHGYVRTAAFEQPANPLSLESIFGEAAAPDQLYWEMQPDSTHAGLWRTRQVRVSPHEVETGAYSYPQPYEQAINTLALMMLSEKRKDHRAVDTPDAAQNFLEQAEREGFIENTHGYLIRHDAPEGGRFQHEAIERAKASQEKALAEKGGIYTDLFQAGTQTVNLTTTLARLDQIALLENDFIDAVVKIDYYSANRFTLSLFNHTPYIEGSNKHGPIALNVVRVNKGYDGCDYSETHVHAEDAVFYQLNRALNFIDKNPQHILTTADQKQFKQLIGLIGIEILARMGQQFFNDNTTGTIDSAVNQRIRRIHTTIGQLKDYYLPGVPAEFLGKIEAGIISGSFTAKTNVARRVLDIFCERKNQFIAQIKQGHAPVVNAGQLLPADTATPKLAQL